MEQITGVNGIHYETGKPVRVGISEGLITGISEATESMKSDGLFVAPGLIDNQINGYHGVDFSAQSLPVCDMRRAVGGIRYDGVTTFQPTVITGSHENLVRNFRNLARATEDQDVRDSVPGFHLEGPYISPEPGFYGCHPADYIRNPSWNEFSELQEEAGGNIRQITMAPELPGAFDFISRCVQAGVIVALGHTNASADQIAEAVRHGATLSTHLGNGCANMIDRHRNPLWPQLADQHLTPSLIADGHHLLPEEIQVFLKVKGPKNLIVTSDVTHLTGMPPGNYNYLGSDIVLTSDGLIKNPVLNCLAGASMPLRTGIGTMMNYTGCSLGEAINFATINVSRVCRLTDRGVLEAGKRADLILFEMEGNAIKIRQVVVRGRVVRSC